MKILLAISGSISAYKTPDLLRKFIKNGHIVRVILTKGACKFVRPKIFSYLGAETVYRSNDDFKHINDNKNPILHISLARWFDRFIIAPASANTISKLAQGNCDNLLSSVFMSLKENQSCLLFPAMNPYMFNNPILQNNIKTLKQLKKIKIHLPDIGEMACGEDGEGRLPNNEKIVCCSETYSSYSRNETVLITAGATVAPLDSIRYLTNSSSGITGFYLAQKALSEGYSVIVIAGKYATSNLELLEGLDNYKLVRVTTAQSMEEAVNKYFPRSKIYISAAAINDIYFKNINTGKLKKKDIKSDISINKTSDILKSVLKQKTSKQKVIGFAAETELIDKQLKEKLKEKPVDLMIGTQVNNGFIGNSKAEGFIKENGKYTILLKNKIIKKEVMKKRELANTIINIISNV